MSKIHKKIVCLVLISSFIFSFIGPNIIAYADQNERQEHLDKEIDVVEQAVFRDSISTLYLQENLTSDLAQGASLIGSNSGGLFSMIKTQMIALNMIQPGEVLSLELITANIGLLLSQSSAIVAAIKSLAIVVVPYIPWIIGAIAVVGAAVSVGYLLNKYMTDSESTVFEDIAVTIINFLGNSDSDEMSLSDETMSVFANDANLLGTMFVPNVDGVYPIEHYGGEGLTVKNEAWFSFNVGRVSGDSLEYNAPFHPIVYHPGRGEYVSIRGVSLYKSGSYDFSWSALTYRPEYNPMNGGLRDVNQVSQVDVSSAREAALNNDPLGAFQELGQLSDYPVFYTDKYDQNFTKLKEINRQLHEFRSGVQNYLNDTHTASSVNIDPSQVYAEYMGQRVSYNSSELSTFKSVDTGEIVPGATFETIRTGFDVSLPKLWLDSTFRIDGNDFVWDYNNTGKIYDVTGDLVSGLDFLSVTEADMNDIKTRVRAEEIDAELDDNADNYYLYTVVDLIKDEFSGLPDDWTLRDVLDKIRDDEMDLSSNDETEQRYEELGHTLQRHFGKSEAFLRDRFSDRRFRGSVATSWGVPSIFHILYSVNKSSKLSDTMVFSSTDDVEVFNVSFGHILHEDVAYGIRRSDLYTKISGFSGGRFVFKPKDKMQFGSDRNYRLLTGFPIEIAE